MLEQKKFNKKKALQATWDDSDEDDLEEDEVQEEIANMCFMAIEDERMSYVLSGTRPKALPYGMILTIIFQHFDISFRDSVAILPKATDTINVLTLKQMKIFKENRQCVVKSKGFDDESGPSTLPFEGEDIHDDEDAPPAFTSTTIISAVVLHIRLHFYRGSLQSTQ
ncbi:Uncharacterized protein Adt_21729 [Abeliophyllum distichum]|uniref:Uncharacterized protein n=1 Tax=Abeliophyllum distichum TaxID=126358 RepID=A0ABD1T0C8_9LAMI